LACVFACSSKHQLDSQNQYEPIQLIEAFDTMPDETSLELETDTQTVTLEYYGWGCPCPQWITPENKLVYALDLSKKLDVFWNIKAANDSVPNPFDLAKDMNALKFEFKGQFFKYPQLVGDEGEQTPAKTFRYISVKWIED
jgi:hypothetical protein